VKLLVIGATGQLARSLAEIPLEDRDHLSTKGRPEIDLLRPSTIDTAIAKAAPDLVINAAAFTAVDVAESEPERAFAINADGAGLVAICCQKSHIPLIHISTDYVFDGRKPGPYFETDDTDPSNVYGKSKLEGERRVIAECEHATILRSAWIHSPFGNNFTRTMLRLAEKNNTVSVVADQTGSPTYAPHLAEAILSVAKIILTEKPITSCRGTYHATGAGRASWFELAEEIFRQSDAIGGPTTELHPISAEAYSTDATRPANSVLGCSKMLQQFGVTLPDWRLGVADCVARICAG
jgi:dTDP-4-dehydrorhamnose reductase